MSQSILIVDNDSSARLVLHLALEQEGWQVREAIDGADALQMIEQQRPDVVIMDFALPKISGVEVTRALRDKAGTADLPIILLSAFVRHAQEALTAGVNKFLVWPVLGQEITQNIYELLSA